MKKLLHLFILILFPFLAMGQNETVVIEDYNNDGYMDTLTSYYDGGSTYGGRFVTVINGKTKEKFEMDNFGGYYEMKQVVYIPPKLQRPENKSFLDAIKKELLPIKADFTEASLQWLITANMNRKTLRNHLYFDLLIFSPTNWIEGKIKTPNSHYIEISGDMAKKLYRPTPYDGRGKTFGRDNACLVYYAHNHYRNPKSDRATLVATSDTYKVYSTSHGIIVRKNDVYAWVFVTDFHLTGSPNKLRNESIGKIQLIDQYLIVQLKNSEDFYNPIFIIDIENGKTARLKLKKDDSYKTIYINNYELTVNKYDNDEYFNLEKIFMELGNLN